MKRIRSNYGNGTTLKGKNRSYHRETGNMADTRPGGEGREVISRTIVYPYQQSATARQTRRNNKKKDEMVRHYTGSNNRICIYILDFFRGCSEMMRKVRR